MTTQPDLAELRRLLDDMRVLANREGIYNGNRAVLDIIGRVEPLLDAAARPGEAVAEAVPERRESPDVAELRRRLDALPGFALRHLHGGPGVEPYIALADEGGMPLSESGFDAVLLFAEIAAADLPALLDAAAERDALAARLAAAEVEARAQAERAVHAERQADHETRMAVHLAGIVSGLRAKIERVRALHAVADCGDSTCEHCPCSTCPPRLGWPCPTIRALDEESQP